MTHARALAVAGCIAAGGAWAQDGGSDEIELGRKEYVVACAGCHGDSGKGDGPIAQLIDV